MSHAPPSAPSSSPSPGKTLLTLINSCDNFPYTYSAPQTTQETTQETTQKPSKDSNYYLFTLLTLWTPTCNTWQTVGYMLPSIVAAMPWTDYFSIDHGSRIVRLPYTMELTESRVLAQVLERARERRVFGVLDAWRGELYPVLGLQGEDHGEGGSGSEEGRGKRVVEVERAGSALFGIQTRGVHCMAYSFFTGGSSGEEETTTTTSSPSRSRSLGQLKQNLRLIIPRRSSTKSTYPSMLDNSIAGGISSTETPFHALLREAEEEASLPARITRRAKPTGTISYIHIRDSRAGGEKGLVQPEIQYCFDLELDLRAGSGEGVGVNDGEVDEFLVLSVEEVWERLGRGEFKPNCGLVLVDFLVRWGFVRAGRDGWMDCGGNDGDGDGVDEVDGDGTGWEVSAEEYAEIVSRLHRKVVWEGVDERRKRMAWTMGGDESVG